MKFYILLENSKMTAEGQIFAIFTDTWPVAKTKELFTRTYRPSLCHSSIRSLSLWKFRMVEITFTFVNWMPSKLIFLYVKSDARFPKKIGGILTTIEWFVFVRGDSNSISLGVSLITFFSEIKGYFTEKNYAIILIIWYALKHYNIKESEFFTPTKICLIFMDRRS